MSAESVRGTRGEDRDSYTKLESRAIRRRSLRLLWSILKPSRKLMVLTAVVILLSSALRAIGPTLIAIGIDDALPQAVERGDWLPAIGITAAFFAAGALGSVLVGWYVVLVAKLTQAVMIELRTRIFRHTQRLSLEFHEGYTSGRIISRQTSDLEAIQELLDGSLNELIDAVLIGLFTLIALFLIDWRSGLVLVGMGVPLALLMWWFVRESQRGFRATRVVSARLIVQFVETMTGIRAVQAFRREKRNDANFAEVSNEYRRVNLKVIRLFGTLDPGLILLANVTIAAVLLWGALRVTDDALAIGVLLAAVLYIRNFFGPLEDVAMFLNSYQSAAAALEKVSGVLEEAPTVADPAHPVRLENARGELRFDGVSFGYGARPAGGATATESSTSADSAAGAASPESPGGFVDPADPAGTTGPMVLTDCNLTVPAGQTVALVGTTGAGKSTLAKLISRFYDPTEGQVLLDGVSLSEIDTPDLRRAIVMVTQEAYLFSGTVADNIALGKPGATDDEIRAAAHIVGADEFINALPDGYDTDVNKRGGRVSAGQRQLISFARAFLADPAVLILDEATASLDLPSERLVQDALQKLLAERTAIIIAHRLSTVEIADRVLVMEHGRVVEDDTPAALIAGEGRFSRLHAAWQRSLS